MGSMFSPPDVGAPAPPPPPPPSAIPPTLAHPGTQLAAFGQRRAAALAAGMGMSDTLKTGSQGDLVPAPKAKAALVGG